MSWFHELRIYLNEKKRFVKEAETYYENAESKGSLTDYKKAFCKHRVTLNEYVNGYEYWKLDEAARNEFISKSEMHCIYRKMIHGRVRNIFHQKDLFLQQFKSFVRRDWALVRNMPYEAFVSFLKQHDAVLKPLDGTCGSGISKVCFSANQDYTQLYKSCVANNMLIEECVSACDEISGFHPNSLNTIRVVTISNERECRIFGALFRMGAKGSMVDNTHAGGVFAPINIETGQIEVPAIDSENNKYINHPDTGKRIQGFMIPNWNKVIDTCIAASKIVPGTVFGGWDVCILPDGNIEIIEGNHAPDFDGGLQTPLKIGVKKKLYSMVNDLYGFSPEKFISIMSPTFNNYDFYCK